MGGPHIRDYRPEDFEKLWAIDQVCFDPQVAWLFPFVIDVYRLGFYQGQGAAAIGGKGHRPAPWRRTKRAKAAAPPRAAR